MTALLSGVVTGFAGAGVTLPDIAYPAPGSVAAYDGEQTTVNLVRLFPGRPGAEQSYQHLREEVVSAEFLVAIVRNTPVQSDDGSAPSAAVLGKAAMSCVTDAVTLRNVLTQLRDSYAIAPPGVPVFVGQVLTEGPQGGVHAVTGRVLVQLV